MNTPNNQTSKPPTPTNRTMEYVMETYNHTHLAHSYPTTTIYERDTRELAPIKLRRTLTTPFEIAGLNGQSSAEFSIHKTISIAHFCDDDQIIQYSYQDNTCWVAWMLETTTDFHEDEAGNFMLNTIGYINSNSWMKSPATQTKIEDYILQTLPHTMMVKQIVRVNFNIDVNELEENIDVECGDDHLIKIMKKHPNTTLKPYIIYFK